MHDRLERILIVGVGSIGSRHVRVARQVVAGAQVVALRHGPSSGAPPVGVDECVYSLEAALAFRPQLAVVSSPASKHLETALPLARSGVHLLVEKPLSSSVVGVAELIEACRSAEVVLMTGYNLRFLPSLRLFRELVVGKRVGRTLSVRAEVGQYLPTWRPSMDYRQTVSARSELGGGVLLELSHEIDYLLWLFGAIEWVSATLRRQGDLEIDVEDTALLHVGFARSTGEAQVVASLNMDFVRHDHTRTCTVIGETGSLRWNAVAGAVELWDKGASGWAMVSQKPPSRDESYVAEWRHLVSCVGSGEQPAITGEDGLTVLRVIDAARRSSATGGIVRVEQRIGAPDNQGSV